jgi:hypothetical protein
VDQSHSTHEYENRTKGNQPFLPAVCITRKDETGVLIVPELRTSGLLLLLPAVDLKCLITLLTFAVRNGQTTHCIASLRQLAYAMHTTEPKARRRLTRLQHFVWDAKPLVHEVVKANGLSYYIPSAAVFATTPGNVPTHSGEEIVRGGEGTGNNRSTHIRRSPIRDVIVAVNRKRYAQPRNVVEQKIAEQMEWNTKSRPDGGNEHQSQPQQEPEDELKLALRKNGLSRVQADYLLQNFDRAAIRQQLEWLPLRYAKSPGRYLYAAIEHSYGAPRGARTTSTPRDIEGSDKAARPLRVPDDPD